MFSIRTILLSLLAVSACLGQVSSYPQNNSSSITLGGAVQGAGNATRLRDFVSVKDYGAVCNGTTDDSTAIQNAINSFGAVGNGKSRPGIVWIPCGAAIASSLTLQNKSVTLMGNGWGSSTDSSPSGFLKWTGSAGSPMVLCKDDFGCDIENLRFIGNSAAKPSAAIEIQQGTGAGTQTQKLASLKRIWIGEMFGLDSDSGSHQFTNGILLSGTTNGDSNTFEHIFVNQSDTCVNVSNGNASDTHFNTLVTQNCGIGLDTAATITGTNWLMTNNTTADIKLEVGGRAIVNTLVSEKSARLALFAGGQASLSVIGGSYQAFAANIAADGRFIDANVNGQTSISLKDFALTWESTSYAGPVPLIRQYNAGGGASTTALRLEGTRGIYDTNLELGSVVGTNDARNVIFEPAQESGQDPQPLDHVMLNYAQSADRAFQSWRNDFAGKVNIYGGEFRVQQLAAPGGLTCTPTGGSGTTYGYKVTALTYLGESLPSSEITCSGGAVLSVSVTNTVAWNPVLGARGYKVYGRTAAGELLMSTVTYSGLHLGLGLNTSPPSFIDNGSLTPSGALPTTNTTGASTFDGNVTVSGNLTVSGTLSATPGIVTASECYHESFLAGSLSSNQIGQYGWQLTTIAHAGSVSNIAGSGSNGTGQTRLNTAAASGDGESMDLGGGLAASGALANLSTGNAWVSSWIVRPNTTTTVQVRNGYLPGANATAIPVNGIYLCYDTSTGCDSSTLDKTHWNFCVSVSSTETCYATSVTPSSAFYRWAARQVSSGKIGFTLYDSAGAVLVAEKTLCSAGCDVTVTPPTGVLSPATTLITQTSSAANFTHDDWQFCWTSLTR